MLMVKCPVCGRGELRKEKRKSELYGFSLGEYMAEVCPCCGEIFWSEEDVALMEKKAREKGIWGLEQRAKIAVAGNSLIVRIPQKLAKFLRLKKGTEVIIHPQDKDKLLIEEIPETKQS
jgi:DNA repair exonuclease SbcCD ATPase subunit